MTDNPHGTRARYATDKCRCNACRTAANLYRQEWRAKARKKPRDLLRHGKPTTYGEYGCRCLPCRMAQSAYDASRHSNGKAA